MYDMQGFDAFYESPIGWLGIQLQGDSLSQISWLNQKKPQILQRKVTPLVNAVTNTLDTYFRSVAVTPKFTYCLEGTSFQQRVWRALQAIPSGTVKTYGELAADLNTSSRAIGQACKRNPISILIPCHRVVAAKGIGGYMGGTRKTHIKQWLLQHEGIH